MGTATFVLIMIFGGLSYKAGSFAVIQQEFSSHQQCEAARQELAKRHDGYAMPLKAQGCFKK